MKLSVLSSVMLIPAFFLMSCSQGGPNLSDSSKASIGGVASADNNSGSEPIARSLPRKKRPKAFDKYNISFWDSLKTKEQHRSAIKMVALSHESSEETTSDFSQMRPNELAFRLGAVFANNGVGKFQERKAIVEKLLPDMSDFSDTVALETMFQKCVMAVEKNKQHGTAAIMISGYYFEYLSQIIENVNETTHLPNEQILSEGIIKLDSLKSYCNESLMSEPDINITLPIQRIIAATDSIKAIYTECLTVGGENKYDKLHDVISETEAKIFEDRK
ncbi:MAG: hypothetical protein II937_05180 [Bacteroidales bacterium]|nr:hypothetical protein [Bacteroidales bacterium]